MLESVDRESDAEGSAQEEEDDYLWTLYNIVRNFKTSPGQLLCEPFLKLPSKRYDFW